MYFPKQYRYIDWATYGTVWLAKLSGHPLRNDVGQDHNPDKPERYVVLDAPHPARYKSLQDYLQDRRYAANEKRSILKQLACGLRYSYLDGREITEVDVHWDNNLQTYLILFLEVCGRSFYIEPIKTDDNKANMTTLIQGACPGSWYDINRWQRIRPIRMSSESTTDYPLSSPSYFNKRYNKQLRMIGASNTGGARWQPPPGTANDDLSSFMSMSNSQYQAGYVSAAPAL